MVSRSLNKKFTWYFHFVLAMLMSYVNLNHRSSFSGIGTSHISCLYAGLLCMLAIVCHTSAHPLGITLFLARSNAFSKLFSKLSAYLKGSAITIIIIVIYVNRNFYIVNGRALCVTLFNYHNSDVGGKKLVCVCSISICNPSMPMTSDFTQVQTYYAPRHTLYHSRPPLSVTHDDPPLHEWRTLPHRLNIPCLSVRADDNNMYAQSGITLLW